MELYLIKSAGTKQDISNLITKAEWSGSIKGAARSCTIDYINAPYDSSYQKMPAIQTGDYLSLVDNSIELFFGQIYGTEKSTATGTITYTAYDMVKNLTESTGQYNFKNTTPEAAAAQVLNDIQVPYNNLPATGINIASLIFDQKSYYDIIMSLYTAAYKVTGTRYIPMIWARQFGLWPATYTVGNFALQEDLNLLSVDIQESMDDLKNRVRIYNDKGTQTGELSDDESIGTFGVFQEIYKEEKGVDPQTAAKKLLKTEPAQTLSVEAINDNNCQSGYSIVVYDSATGLSGKYWITSDTHTWEGEKKTMKLDLSFEALMDETEAGKEETEESKS